MILLLLQNIQYRIMLSKKFKHNYSISCKLSFKTSSPLKLLIVQIKKILPLLEKLLGTSVLRDCNIEKVIQILENFPKAYERNISILNQASAIELLVDIIKYLQSSKKYRKFKPYHLYTSWKSIEEILVKRFTQEIKGNLEQISINHQNTILYNFIREIEYISSKIQDWAKLKSTKKERLQTKFYFIYSEAPSVLKTLPPTTRHTGVSSVCVSREGSKHQKQQNEESIDICQNQKINVPRSGTAKLQRKQIKMARRCPSANQLLENAYFKKPSFQTKKSLKRNFSKTNEHNKGNKILSKKTKKYSELMISNKINQNQQESNILIQTNIRKVSILNKNFQNKAPESTHFVTDQICKIPSDVDKNLSQLLINRDDVDKSNQVNQNNLFSIDKEICLLQINEQIKNKEIPRTHQRKNTGNFSKRRENKSQLLEQQKRISIQSSQPLQKHQIKIKKSKVNYKVPRKTGKMSIKSIESIKSLEKELSVKNQVNIFTTRRKAMLSEKKMSQIQQILNQSKKQAEYNKIKFQENVLLALTETLKVQKKIEKKQSLSKNQSNQTFYHMYSELNEFIKGNEFNTQITHVSSFFEQQQYIKRAQDLVLKEKIKSLMKKQPLTSIFELSCVTKNSKDFIYNQIERQFSFFSDAEWIKQICQMENNLQQKNI